MMMKMEKELEYGPIEYKRKLINKSQSRIEKLASQMKYRCEEGGSECIYNIGVDDDGTMLGITEEEYEETINTLNIAAETNNYSVNLLTVIDIDDDKKVYEVLIRENNENKYIDVKIAIAGAVDAGKSSLLGILTTGRKDDGRGLARMAIFNYVHEIKSGRTSSIAHHILGFNNEGCVVNYQGFGKLTWPDIVKRSSKIISFFDLAGHEKYLKTTILGLSSSFPDVCFIIVGANMGISIMTREHIFLCITLRIPFVIILTKIDICINRKNILDETVKNINKLLKHPGVRRIPVSVKSKEDIIICAKNVGSESIVPIFHVSNVTGEGINNLKQFLNLLKKRKKDDDKDLHNVIYHIDSTFSVTGVGTVTGGHLLSGIINVGDKLFIGPNNGIYEQTTIKSIHCKRVSLQNVSHGSYVCLGLKKIERKKIRRGNVIISNLDDQLLIKTFSAHITVMRAHSTTICKGYEPVLYACAVRQSVKLISVDEKNNSRNTEKNDDIILRTGDRAKVTFEFCYQPEFLKVGTRILLAEGKCKIVGIII
jgi:GTPase